MTGSLGYIQVPAVGPGTSWFDVARAGVPTWVWGTDPRFRDQPAIFGATPRDGGADVGVVLLAGAALIGGAVLVRAALDHAAESRRRRAVDADLFEEAHYGAAGFERADEAPSLGADLLRYGAAIGAAAWFAWQVPQLWSATP